MNRWMLTRWSRLTSPARPRQSAKRVRLTLDALEVRVVPAVISVSNTNDAGSGSLRAALISVNASADVTNTVTFIPGLTGTITLAGDLPTIAKPVAVQGPGAAVLTINGNGNKLFSFDDGAATALAVSLSGLTIAGGKNTTTGGGGIYSKDENVTVLDSVIRNNAATGVQGGGVRADGGTFTLTNTKVLNNTANDGAGIRNAGATFVISGSTIDGNNATSSGGTGGYYQSGGALQDMTNSTVTNNQGGNGAGLFITGGPATIVSSLIAKNNSTNAATSTGGGLAVAGGAVVLKNVTVSGNKANDAGGGIHFTSGTLEIRNSTVSFNVSDADNSGANAGGGLFENAASKAKVFSTILAKNQRRTDGTATQSDVSGELDGTSANNLVGVDTGLTGITNTVQGNQVGTSGTPRDPLLGALAYNGGATKTHALQPTSPAKDTGDTTGLGLTTDGRGAPFARVVGTQADVGAFELQTAPLTLVVTSAADRNNATYNAADLTLREALRFAGTDAGIVTFAPALSGQTIALSLGRLVIDRAIDIQGPGAGQLTLSGNNLFQLFSVTDNDSTTAIEVKVSGLTLTNGKADSATGGDTFGGAMRTFENVTLDGVVLTNNVALSDSGAIDHQFGTLIVKNSTVSNNSSGTRGGGIGNYSSGTVSILNTTISGNQVLAGGTTGGGLFNNSGGTIVVKNSTVSGNKAITDGGGIFNSGAGTILVSDSTISGNQANNNGGGVGIAAGILTLNNSTVAFNKAEADGAGAGKGGGVFIGGGSAKMTGTIVAKNEVGTTGTNVDISGTINGKFSLVLNTTGWDQTGSSNNKLGVDPLLGLLANNGGLTFTHALPATGPATDPGFLDADINPDALTADQRGTGFPRKTGASIDIGAFEFTPNTAPTISDVTNKTTSIGIPVGPLPFTVGDAETPPAALVVTGTSSNTTLVPAANVVVGGTGANRTVTVTPAAGQTGTTTIALTVTDGSGLTATDTFVVTVNPTGTTVATVLVGVPLFAVGTDAGTGGTATLFNPDKSVRFAVTPFGADFTGGVRTAAGDFNGDGVADLVVGTGPGRATRVIVLDGATQAVLFTIDPFEAGFTGGVYVAAGDLNGDGLADLVITPDEGGGPRARVFSGNKFAQLADFFGIEDVNFRGGARGAIADITGDGKGDLVVAAGFGGGPRVGVFDGAKIAAEGALDNQTFSRWNGWKPFGDFLVFEAGLRNGAFVTAGDLDGDGFAELIAGGGPGGGPRVTAYSGKGLLGGQQTVLANFFAGDVNSRGGVRVAVKNLDGDNRADVVVGAGVGAGSRVTAYAGKSIGAGTPPELYAFDAVGGFVGGVFVG